MGPGEDSAASASCRGAHSGSARKRPRPLEEAVEADNGVALKFSDSFALENQNLVLLQVPESLLNEIGEDADRGLVKLIGGEDEDAVLVTGGQTFKLIKAETSNTLLLVPPEGTSRSGGGGGGGVSNGSENNNCGGREWAGDEAKGEGGFEAVAAVGFQFEVSKATPSLEQIRVILEDCLYRGKGEEAAMDRERLEACTLAELQTRVQFSHRELLQGLKELEALEINGRWRMVDPALMERTADALLAVVIEEDFPLDKVDGKACIAALPDFEPLVVEHCLRTYSLPTNNVDVAKQNEASPATGDADDDAAGGECADATPVEYQLDLDKVARLRAHQILRTHEAQINGAGSIHHHPDVDGPLSLGDFMERWAASMPGVDTPSQDLLKGIALVGSKYGEGKSKDASFVSYVPASGLPFAPIERLAALFRIKPKWRMAELEAYISEDDRKSGFLLKNTRSSTDPATGQKLFSAR